MLRVLSLLCAVILVVFASVLIVGYLAPVEYSGSTSRYYDFNVEEVFNELTEIENISRDRKDVKQVVLIERRGELLTWRENLENGGYRVYRMIGLNKTNSYAIQMLESYNKVTGTWNFNIEKAGGGTTVTVLETSKTESLWFRGLYTFSGRNIESRRILNYLEVSLLHGLIRDS